MYRGKFVAIVNADEVSKEYVGLLMAGVPVEQAGKPKGRRTVEVTL
jgi:simple sugar transport system ATP-binding protein